MIEIGRERQLSYDKRSHKWSLPNSPNSPAYNARNLALAHLPIVFLRFLTYFCCNFHFVLVIENHPITAHVTPVIRISKVASVRPRHPQSPHRGTGTFLGLRARQMKRKYIVRIFAYRIALALLTRTIFQPDEFFQSLEVAHTIVFGYGKLTWEWQPDVAIRSIVYPALYMPVYWALRVTGLDATGMLVCEFADHPESPKRHI